MTFARPKRINGRVPVLTAEEAVKYIPDESTLCVLGAGGGILEATKLIEALAERYKTTQTPKNIGIISPTGLGDRAERGISPIAQEGLVKWALCGHWGQSPRISELAEQNKIFAYNYPQGVLTQMLRASAAHQPGILSEIGLGTFVDPRNQGGKLNDITKEDLISLVNLEGKEYLYYKTVAPNVAFIRATTCDSEGYATFEDEVMYLDALVIAEAVHNNGGIVMMQVQKMVKKATLHPKAVRIPGYLVDIVVVDPAQTQLYGGAPVNRFISGDFTLDDSERVKIPLNQRKVVARRALYEMKKGAIGNVGVGIADGIGLVAREEKVKCMNMRHLVLSCAVQADRKESMRETAALAKLYCARTALEVIDDAIQIMGGLGYTNDARVSRLWRDVRCERIGGGTDEIMIYIAGRQILKAFRD